MEKKAIIIEQQENNQYNIRFSKNLNIKEVATILLEIVNNIIQEN